MRLATRRRGGAPARPASPFVVLLALAPPRWAATDRSRPHVLIRTAPPSRMALTFSIKQTGGPAGAALAGALLPGLALALGWRATYLAIAALGIMIVIAAQPTRTKLDDDRQPGRAISLAGVFAPLKIVIGTRALAELAVTGFFYAATQVCLSSFLVIYLTETLHFGIVAAGLALTVANIGGIVGRIAWGGTADRWVPPRILLGSIGVVAALCAFATAAFGASWSVALVYVVCALFGATAIGWNGVQLPRSRANRPPAKPER
jgi:predicted MFS family arabinose efflux permease